MDEFRDDLTDQANSPQLDRRQLLRTAGLGFSLGAAGLLLPEDADARRRRRRRSSPRRLRRRNRRGELRPGLGWPKWLDVEMRIANMEPTSQDTISPRPIKVEIWVSNNGDDWWRTTTADTLQPDGKRSGAFKDTGWHTYSAATKYIVAWIDDKYLAWAHNPFVGFPECALGYGGSFGTKSLRQ